MMAGFAIPLVGEIINRVLGIVDKAVPDKTEANRLKSEITKALIEQQTDLNEAMKEIAIREVSGTKFQSYWRPMLSWMVIFMWPYNYILRPILISTSGIDLPPIDQDALTTITAMWTTVYGLGRSFEKSGSSISLGKN
jgi:hypothetical protein